MMGNAKELVSDVIMHKEFTKSAGDFSAGILREMQ